MKIQEAEKGSINLIKLNFFLKRVLFDFSISTYAHLVFINFQWTAGRGYLNKYKRRLCCHRERIETKIIFILYKTAY